MINRKILYRLLPIALAFSLISYSSYIPFTFEFYNIIHFISSVALIILECLLYYDMDRNIRGKIIDITLLIIFILYLFKKEIIIIIEMFL